MEAVNQNTIHLQALEKDQLLIENNLKKHNAGMKRLVGNLSSDIQVQLLFLPDVKNGHDPVTEHQIREIGSSPEWSEQWKARRELNV